MLLDDLLKHIPFDTEERVRRGRDRFNQSVREALRQETGLRLRRGSRTEDSHNVFGPPPHDPVSAELASVRVQMLAGLPLSLKQKEIDEKDALAALIAPWRAALESLRASISEITKLLRILDSDPQGRSSTTAGSEHLPTVAELADRLLRESSQFNLAEWILDVNEDVLGIYRIPLPEPKRPYLRVRQNPTIELYWAVIGLLARLLAVDVEDLTVVVVAHELAHAYTHIGTDIDGHAWTNEEFARSQHELREGLAQHYTHAVCKHLSLAAPGAMGAYKRLLEVQPNAYHTHEPWEAAPAEAVRLELLQARRAGPGQLGMFEGFLEEAAQSLRR